MKRWYVTMTWDNWPEGGSYGTVVEAENQDEAERLVRNEMAESRVHDAQSPEEVIEMWGDEWEVVDCFDLDEFIMRNRVVRDGSDYDFIAIYNHPCLGGLCASIAKRHETGQWIGRDVPLRLCHAAPDMREALDYYLAATKATVEALRKGVWSIDQAANFLAGADAKARAVMDVVGKDTGKPDHPLAEPNPETSPTWMDRFMKHVDAGVPWEEAASLAWKDIENAAI